MKRFLCLLFTTCAFTVVQAAPLEIREGDHICLIGNTLAERMQFEGHNHWETSLHQRFPKHKLVVRNLSWSADEVALRPRAEGFGTPDEHLAFSKADVIIAFFGFNESFRGEAGLEIFKNDLDEWIKHTKAQDYSGKGAPRIALVSPIAAEQLSVAVSPGNAGHRPGTGAPPPATISGLNSRLESYTSAMREVAAKNHVVFADLFAPTKRAFSDSSGPIDQQPAYSYTINGVHLNVRPGPMPFR